MWISRTNWVAEIDQWQASDAGRSALGAAHLRPALLLRVANALAAHADHGTGRHCAVTNTTAAAAAECSSRTVTTVRKLLAAAGFAVEICRGTGFGPESARRTRPSIWHLVSRPRPVDNSAICDLPPSLRDRRLSLVQKNSPSVRARPPRQLKSSRRKVRRYAPRPLSVQRLAAEVLDRTVGLDHGHIGNICDALTGSRLDLTAWTAPRIIAALNTDMRESGLFWPDTIRSPGAFFGARLRRLALRCNEGVPATMQGDCDPCAARPAARQDQPKSVARAAVPHSHHPVSVAVRAAALAEISAILSRRSSVPTAAPVGVAS